MNTLTTFSTTATFDVPMNGCKPGYVFDFMDAIDVLQQLKSDPTHVQRLTLGPIGILDFQYVHHMLSSFKFGPPMSALDELRVMVWYPSGQPSGEDVPDLDLPATLFPSLRTLYLDGVRADWDSDIFARLSSVELRNCPSTRRHTLGRFIGTLPTWTSLTELHLSKFLSVPDREDDSAAEIAAQDTGYLMHLEKLEKLTVEDNVYQVSHIFHSLVPGRSPTVRMVGSSHDVDDDRSPFAAMMPLHAEHPAMIRNAVHVELVLHADAARLHCISPCGVLTLEISDLDRSVPDALPYAFRSSLISLMEIFGARNAPVSSMALTGDISMVSVEDWAMVFQVVCPELSQLFVRGVGWGGQTENFFKALVGDYSPNTGAPLFPGLDSLKFIGVVYDPKSLLDMAGVALQHRAMVQSCRLDSLEMEFFVNDPSPFSGAMAEDYMQKLGQWVRHEVKVDIQPVH
ncbi:hypothetical protein L226DRAFT_610878 [Lentinus tigrinus ALCF2SS1-7]|uniref:F-box domain-containing protein n=1 Tax=Lentinus tigrinus ALCF2SS1-6 TaxID=1328759 RepID=A0A5C2SHN2_9APHY|nr:hypothetical protein L227DRAFT_599466 [Lentinus tigrinus ALCF2SS1-6]RPD77623.1 hypothetical protein L226DRAFT_610878 [Lentinus tigrinus ALCF2SS1-7]